MCIMRFRPLNNDTNKRDQVVRVEANGTMT